MDQPTTGRRGGPVAGGRDVRRPPGPVAVAVVVALALLACAACGTTAGSGGPTTTEAPKPAGRTPSPIAVMVCRPKAQREIADALGLTATVGPRTWADHLYSCPYDYPDGSFTLSIKELSSWGQTLAYFHGIGAQLGDTGALPNLGQGAFQTTGGDVVVRKDWKVLLVDVAGLPAQFGVPPTSAGDVAVTVADVILGCWDGD